MARFASRTKGIKERESSLKEELRHRCQRIRSAEDALSLSVSLSRKKGHEQRKAVGSFYKPARRSLIGGN